MPEDSTKHAPCIGCGAPVAYRTNAKVCCPSCRKERRRASAKAASARMRRKAGIAPVKGTVGQCADCRGQFTRGNVRQYRCPPCQAHADTQKARRFSRDRSKCAKRRERYNRWYREKLATDPAWKLSGHMRVLIHRALRGKKQGRSWRNFVDYTVDELIAHLERQFLPGMSWDNHGEWHVDHIVPRSEFQYTDPDDEAFKRCWALSNLRPLWATDNMRKNATRTHLI